MTERKRKKGGCLPRSGLLDGLIVFGVESTQESFEVIECHVFLVLVLVFGPEMIDKGSRYLDAKSAHQPHELVLRQHPISRSVDFAEQDTDL